MDSFIPVAEAENDLSALLDRVQRGETIVLTRDGNAVADLTPPSDMHQRRLRVLRDLADFRASQPAVATDSATLIREMRDESW